MESPPFISIIVPAVNEAATLSETIDRLRGQSCRYLGGVTPHKVAVKSKPRGTGLKPIFRHPPRTSRVSEFGIEKQTTYARHR